MIDRERLIASLEAEGFFVTEWTDEPNASYAEHVHETNEVRVVLEGSMTITTAGRTIDLAAGDRLDVAAGQPHSAVVGYGGVRYLAGR
jgi:quercetin dioxygenase-like cupin family protein